MLLAHPLADPAVQVFLAEGLHRLFVEVALRTNAEEVWGWNTKESEKSGITIYKLNPRKLTHVMPSAVQVEGGHLEVDLVLAEEVHHIHVVREVGVRRNLVVREVGVRRTLVVREVGVRRTLVVREVGVRRTLVAVEAGHLVDLVEEAHHIPAGQAEEDPPSPFEELAPPLDLGVPPPLARKMDC
jgi:hypothetical protein